MSTSLPTKFGLFLRISILITSIVFLSISPLFVDTATADGPDARITNIWLNGQEVNAINIMEGEPFTISVRGYNYGTAAEAGSSIGISFPSFTNSTDSQYVSEASFTDPDIEVSLPQYRPGVDDIDFKCPTKSGPYPAEYLLVDSIDTNGWAAGESNDVTLQVTPQSAGTFHVYIKVSTVVSNTWKVWPDATNADTTDQQCEYVLRRTVNVLPPTPTIDTLSPDNGPIGTRVTIQGSNFGDSRGSGYVDFAGVTIASDVVSWSDTQIVVDVPSNAPDGYVRVHTDDDQTSNPQWFDVRPSPVADITSDPPLSCPSSVPVGEPFEIYAEFQNVSGSTAENGGISISFPSLTAQDSGMTAGGSGPYDTSQARVETVSTDSGVTMSYFDQGDQIYINDVPGPAQHLLVESNSTNWTVGTTKYIRIRITPKVANPSFKVRLRGALGWGGEDGWDFKDRDPHATGSGRELDQQQRPVYYCTINVAEPANVDIPILMYHGVDDAAYEEYFISADLFEKQMDALAAYGYDTVTLQDYLNYRDGLATPPDHPIILTFDDGYLNNYTHAYPILKERNMIATVFINTGLTGETEEDRCCANYPRLVWDPEIYTLYSEGFQIESHTVWHPHLTQIPGSQAQQEIADSRTDIQNHLGNQCYFFCYPYGDGAYDPTIRSYVQQAGYRAAVAVGPWGIIANTATSDIWALPRLGIAEYHLVDLDPSHPWYPWNFFMRAIDPNFPLPDITIDSVEYFHQDGTPGTTFSRGETITVAVTASNDGDPVNVQVALQLDDDDDHSGSLYYNNALSGSLGNGETKTFNFVVTLPDDVALGQHYYAVPFRDEYDVLGFKYSDWQASFETYTTIGASILLVDDDDNDPDVRSFYTEALDALGVTYDVWSTGNSDNEPDAVTLDAYSMVIWFTGDEYGGFAGPGTAGEAALASFLDDGKYLFISSQDYYYDRGLTPFMSTYLGVVSASSDVAQTTVTGAGSVFEGLGPYALSYPFDNWSDRITPDGTAELAFSGNQGDAAVNKDSGVYRTTFWGFPFEALPNETDRLDAVNTILTWCDMDCSTPGTPTLVAPTDGSTTDDNTPTFEWNGVIDSDEYQIQIDNNSDFSSPERDETITSTDHTPASDLSDGTYYWRVRGHNTSDGCDAYGLWSNTWWVTVDTLNPSSSIRSIYLPLIFR